MAALTKIDGVHVDGDLGPASIMGFSAPTAKCGRYDPQRREIGLNVKRNDHEQTIAHEVGHLLAIEGIGGGNCVCEAAPELAGWRNAVLASATHQRLRRIQIDGYAQVQHAKGLFKYPLSSDDMDEVEYLLLWEEVWARAYCQFIATRSGSKRMLQQLKDETASDYGLVFMPNWPWSDFAQIEMALESFLKNRGWM